MAPGFRSGGVLDALGENLAARSSGPAASSGTDLQRILAAGAFSPAKPTTLLIDYDGTLVPYASTPDKAAPDVELLRLLEALAARREIDLHLVSGRSVRDIARWFGSLNASLWAEHGAARRLPGRPWEILVADASEWMSRVRSYLETFTAETHGSLLEQKQTALAWHYRLVDPDLAPRRLRRLRDELPRVLEGVPADILEGRMVMEVRPRGVSKGLVVRYVLRHLSAPEAVVAIGDDRTDEDMFAELPPSWGVAIRVGGGATGARYGLPDFRAVRRLLTTVLDRLAPAATNTEELR